MINMEKTTTEVGSISLPKKLWRELRKRKEKYGIPVSTQIQKSLYLDDKGDRHD